MNSRSAESDEIIIKITYWSIRDGRNKCRLDESKWGLILEVKILPSMREASVQHLPMHVLRI